MSLRKTLKSVALAGVTFAAGLGGYHLANHNAKNASIKEPVGRQTSIQFQKVTEDACEFRAGVLMPLEGETPQNYEARRVRLEKQESQFRARMVQHYQDRLKTLRAQKAHPKIIAAVAERLAENQQQVQYISCYTLEGQKRLKAYNDSRNQLNNRFFRQREVDDF